MESRAVVLDVLNMVSLTLLSFSSLGLGLLPDEKKPKLMHGTLIMKDNVSNAWGLQRGK